MTPHNKLERLIVYLYNIVKYVWICFLLIMIGSNENFIFRIYILNKDTSVIKQGRIMKFSGLLLHVILEGNVSQIFYLGPSFYFMLIRRKKVF